MTHPAVGKKPASVVSIEPNNPIARFLSPVHTLKDTPKTRGARHALAMMHESDEARSFRGLKPNTLGAFILRRKHPAAQIGVPLGLAGLGMATVGDPSLALFSPGRNRIVGKHASLGVLGNESNNVLRLKAAGLSNADLKLPLLRQRTGEDQLINYFTGKNYGQDFLDNGNLKSLRDNSRGFLHLDHRGSFLKSAPMGGFLNRLSHVLLR